MLKQAGYFFICLLLLGAAEVHAQDKGKGPALDITKAVPNHLDDLLSKEKALLEEITKSNDKAAAFNRRQGEVVDLVEQTISELRRQGGLRGNTKGPAEARMRALTELLKLDAAKEIRTLADFNAFIRNVGQIRAPGEDDAAFKAKYKGQNEASQVLAGFRKTYFDKSSKAGIEKGREDLVKVVVTNPKTLEANVGFKKQPVTPTDSMKSIIEKLDATKKEFAACPTPEKLKADLTEAGKLKADQEKIIATTTKSLGAERTKLAMANKQLEAIRLSLRKQIEKAFIVKGTKGTDVRFDSAEKVEKEVLDQITNSVMAPEFNITKLNDHLGVIHDQRNTVGKDETESTKELVGNLYKRTAQRASDAIVQHATKESWAKGGFMLDVLRKAMTASRADFTMSVDIDAFRNLVSAWRQASTGGGGVPRMAELQQSLLPLQRTLDAHRITLEAAQAALAAHQQRIATLQQCQGDLTTANNAVLGVRGRPREGVDTAGKQALEQAHGLYQSIQNRLSPTPVRPPAR